MEPSGTTSVSRSAAAVGDDVPTRGTSPRSRDVWAWRTVLIGTLLAGWQYLPTLSWLQETIPVFRPFFLSSPTRVADRMFDLVLGRGGYPLVWPFFLETAVGTLVGVAISVVLGASLGLLLSNSALLERVTAPVLALFNATPRIALIPLLIILTGSTLTTSVLTVIIVVTLIVFYNAYSGGVSVPDEMVQNARLLGATPREVMLRVRLPFVLVWTFTALPNAISFGLVAAVTAELLMGRVGMGRLLANSLSTVDSTLTFAVVLLLSIFGLVLVSAASFAQRRVLHWWRA